MARPPKDMRLRMSADLRIPVTADQKRLIAEAVADEPAGLAAWARDILVRAAVERIAERRSGDVDDQSPSMRIRDLLGEIYRLSQREMVHGAGDLIFDFVHDSLRKGDFGAVDRLLDAVEMSQLKPALLHYILVHDPYGQAQARSQRKLL